MNKTIKFLSSLFVVALLFVIAMFIFENNLITRQLILTLYLFTPLIAIVLIEQKNPVKIFKNYTISFKKLNKQKALCVIGGITLLYPIINLTCIYFLGNILGISQLGEIAIPTGKLSLFGVNIAENMTVRIFLLYVYYLIFGLIAGLTYNTLFALGSEVAWRGFLSQNMNVGYYKKNIMTGIIWASWYLPIILCNNDGGNVLPIIIVTYGIYIAFSFLLYNVYRAINSVIISSIVSGIIVSFGGYSIVKGGLNYSNGIIMIISILILILIFSRYIKNKKV